MRTNKHVFSNPPKITIFVFLLYLNWFCARSDSPQLLINHLKRLFRLFILFYTKNIRIKRLNKWRIELMSFLRLSKNIKLRRKSRTSATILQHFKQTFKCGEAFVVMLNRSANGFHLLLVSRHIFLLKRQDAIYCTGLICKLYFDLLDLKRNLL